MNDMAAGISFFAFLLSIGFTTLYILGGNSEARRVQLRLFLWAFGLRFLLSVIIYQCGLINVILDEDGSGWTAGIFLQEQWLRHHLPWWELPSAMAQAFEGRDMGYRFLLGALFYVTDAPFRLVAAALNDFFGALICVFAWRTARRLFSPRVASLVGWWACLFPSMLIWSAQTIKEPVVILLETAALYSCVRLKQLGPTPRHLAFCVAAIVLLLAFRFYAAYIIGAAVLVALLARGLAPGRVTMAALALVALMGPFVFGSAAFARHTAEIERFNLQKIQYFRESVSTGGSRYGASSGVRAGDVRTTHGLVYGTVIGAAHLLLAPFPWEIRGASLRMLLTLPELLIWWRIFFIGVLPGTRYLLRHRLADVSPILLVLLGFGLLYSMMFGNVGLVFRQRAQLLPWLLIFGAVGIEQRYLRLRAARDRLSRVRAARAHSGAVSPSYAEHSYDHPVSA
jgi:hypothetical protein